MIVDHEETGQVSQTGKDTGAPQYGAGFLDTVINTVADPLFVKDRAHRWVALNEAYCRFMGYRREELLGKSDPDFFPAPEARVFWDRDDQVFAVGGENVSEELFTDSGGVTHVIVTKKTVFVDEHGDRFLVGVIRDVTELRRAQEELIEHRERLEELVRRRTSELSDANARLRQEIIEHQHAETERLKLEVQIQQVQKLESLGVLAGGIAHDFNNLLAGILGNADLALAELPQDSSARGFVEETKRAAIRSAGLTNQMLAYSGRGRFVVDVIDLNALVQDLSGLLAVGTAKKVETRFEFTEPLPAVEVDTSQIRQVVMNLLTNASEAVGEEVGTVTIRTGAVILGGGPIPGMVLDQALARGQYVFLEVQDTGCGMTAETRSRIFDPFFTTKATGRGLGLAAVLGIVRAHRGTITVASVPGQGSTFRVLLPSTERLPTEVAASPGQPREKAWRGTGKVLVVDDDDMLRRMMTMMLEGAGLKVVTAVDGREAIDVFRREAGEVALILLDLTMPTMNGAEALAELRAIRPDIRVILTSGYNEGDVVVGADDFLHKPFTQKLLLEKVRKGLER
jgi:PAS domain S-box-containing protein